MRYTNLRCPACNHQFDDYMQIGGEEYKGPRPGSLGICIECGDLHEFQENGTIRSLTKEEYTTVIKGSETVRQVLEAMRKVKEETDGHWL